MKKELVLVCVWVFLGGKISAQHNDTVWTTHKKGVFYSEAQTCVKTSFKKAQGVVNLFVEQFSNDYLKLFDWAFVNMGKNKTDEEKNAFLIDIKSTSFDKMTGVSVMVVDVITGDVRRFKDVEIRSKVTQTTDNATYHSVDIDIFLSLSLLKEANGTFVVKSIGNNQFVINTKIALRFGWFFDIFVTKKMYKKVVEWRLQQFVKNFKREMEK